MASDMSRALDLRASLQGLIPVSTMPQLAEVRDDDDDWTGMTDAASRRKRQVRLNMRAYRRRKALQAAAPSSEIQTTPINRSAYLRTLPVPCWDEQRQAIVYLPRAQAWSLNRDEMPLLHDNAPGPTALRFPLSSDHLITLVQINVLRACHINGLLITKLAPHLLQYDCTSGSLHTLLPADMPDQVPPPLTPTNTQTSVPHEPWVDVFPHPVWRDNLIRALGTFDEDDMCSDMVGRIFEGGTNADAERNGLVVWSPSWHYEGWELSEGFLRKWGWSIKGCEGVLEATNKWRSLRGEEPLRISEVTGEES